MHDCKGNPLAKGDAVLIHGVLREVQGHADYCNCTVENVTPLPDKQVTFCVTLNTQQVERVMPPVVGFSLLDVQEVAQHVVHLLQTQGDTALDLVTTTLRLIKAATNREMLAVFIEINNEIKDINAIIAAVKAEFNL